MTPPVALPTLIILGGDTSFNYLIQRYAERLGYSIANMPVSVVVERIHELNPAAVIFPSMENLEEAQPLVPGLANRDIPLIVCSSLADQIRARELGADYCLVHPFVYDNFSAIFDAVASPDNRQGDGGGSI